MAVDREKAIKAIEICYTVGHNCTECPFFSKDECNDELMHEVLVLLREQEPVKPVCIEYDRAIVLFSCRDCKTQLLYGQRYCHMCGKTVKWNGC